MLSNTETTLYKGEAFAVKIENMKAAFHQNLKKFVHPVNEHLSHLLKKSINDISEILLSNVLTSGILAVDYVAQRRYFEALEQMLTDVSLLEKFTHEELQKVASVFGRKTTPDDWKHLLELCAKYYDNHLSERVLMLVSGYPVKA